MPAHTPTHTPPSTPTQPTRTARTAEEKLALVAAFDSFQAQGGTGQAFARLHGINRDLLYRWRAGKGLGTPHNHPTPSTPTKAHRLFRSTEEKRTLVAELETWLSSRQGNLKQFARKHRVNESLLARWRSGEGLGEVGGVVTSAAPVLPVVPTTSAPSAPTTVTATATAKHLADWRASGLSAREYAAQHSLKPSMLYNWRSVLKQRHKQSKATRATLAVVPVATNGTPAPSAPEHPHVPLRCPHCDQDVIVGLEQLLAGLQALKQITQTFRNGGRR